MDAERVKPGGGWKCCVEHCRSRSSAKDSNLKFHRFPKDEALARKWLRSLGIKQGAHSLYYFQRKRICGLHFTSQDAKKRNKVPTLFLTKPTTSTHQTESNLKDVDLNVVKIEYDIENRADMNFPKENKISAHLTESNIKDVDLNLVKIEYDIENEADLNPPKENAISSDQTESNFKDVDLNLVKIENDTENEANMNFPSGNISLNSQYIHEDHNYHFTGSIDQVKNLQIANHHLEMENTYLKSHSHYNIDEVIRKSSLPNFYTGFKVEM